MAKSLSFWSVILGFIIGIFANSSEDLPLSGYNYGDARFWRFVILAIITLISAIVFYFVESKNSEKLESESKNLNENIKTLNKNINDLINEIRQDRNERKQSNTDKPTN